MHLKICFLKFCGKLCENGVMDRVGCIILEVSLAEIKILPPRNLPRG